MQAIFKTWEHLLVGLNKTHNIQKNLMSVLFIIGLQESGSGFKKYTQTEKTEIIKLAQLKLLSREKYYLKIATDTNNLPIWAGVLPIEIKFIEPITDPDMRHAIEVPESVKKATD